YSDGVVAVDARIVLDDQPPTANLDDRPSPRAAAWMKQLDRAFDAKVVAVVGDKAMNGFLWLRALANFSGKLYSVQIDANEIPATAARGVTKVKGLAEIAEPVDYVVLAVPRQLVPRLLADCAAKKVGAVTAFTAGFRETGDPEGERLEGQIVDIVANAEF